MATQEIAFRAYIKEYITVSTYFDVVTQFIQMLEKVQGEGIQLILDMDQMKVIDGKVHFQLIMEDSVYESGKIKDFIKKITFASVFRNDQKCTRISEFLLFLDKSWNGKELSEITRFIAGAAYAPADTSEKNAVIQNQMPTDGETGVLDGAFWEKVQSQHREQSNVVQSNNGETGVLDPSFWDKALQNPPSQNMGGRSGSSRIPKLVHCNSGKVIIVNKTSFWIGKEGVDLLIDKDVISRRHAELLTRGNNYYLMDNDSTNKTYVDNKAISPKTYVEISNGSRIKFVDEEYEFCID